MTADKAQLLFVDKQSAILDDLRRRLENAGFAAKSAENAKQAQSFLKEHPFDLVISDLCLPDCNGLSFVRKLKHEWPEQNIMSMTTYGIKAIGVEAVKSGASEYLEKPCSRNGNLKGSTVWNRFG